MVRTWLLLACIAGPCVGAAWPASAQLIIPPNLRSPDRQNGKPAVQPNFTSKAFAPWPRLDAGAVLCRTRDDLDQHQRAMAARLAGGEGGPVGSANCRLIAGPTPIDIVTRAAPSATEVRVKGEAATAWTDTWLPAQAPR